MSTITPQAKQRKCTRYLIPFMAVVWTVVALSTSVAILVTSISIKEDRNRTPPVEPSPLDVAVRKYSYIVWGVSTAVFGVPSLWHERNQPMYLFCYGVIIVAFGIIFLLLGFEIYDFQMWSPLSTTIAIVLGMLYRYAYNSPQRPLLRRGIDRVSGFFGGNCSDTTTTRQSGDGDDSSKDNGSFHKGANDTELDDLEAQRSARHPGHDH